MGSANVVTLHVQYWLFAVGLVWALARLLAERVPPWMLWPFVLLLLLAPRIGRRFEVTEADIFLDFLFVLASCSSRSGSYTRDDGGSSLRRRSSVRRSSPSVRASSSPLR